MRITKSTEAILVAYDLRDPIAWEQARKHRRAWGWERSKIHTLDNDRIIIEYLPGRVLGESA
jgi:hypothetical protein